MVARGPRHLQFRRHGIAPLDGSFLTGTFPAIHAVCRAVVIVLLLKRFGRRHLFGGLKCQLLKDPLRSLTAACAQQNRRKRCPDAYQLGNLIQVSILVRCPMVASTKHPVIQIRDLNGQLREVRQTRTARIFSRPRLIVALDRLLMDPPEHDSPDDLRDLSERIGR